MSTSLRSVQLYLRWVGLALCLCATSCTDRPLIDSLTSPATPDLLAEKNQQARSFSGDIYTQQPNFALAQHQLLVLSLNTSGQTVRLASTTLQAQQRVCFSANAQKRLLSNEPLMTESACFGLNANGESTFTLRSQTDTKVSAFLSYDTALKQWNIRSSACIACNLTGLNLSNYNFAGVDFSQADLSKAQLRQADFSHSNLTNTHFDGAHLQEADFDEALMTQTVMKNADLTDAKLETAKKIDVRFDGAIRNF